MDELQLHQAALYANSIKTLARKTSANLKSGIPTGNKIKLMRDLAEGLQIHLDKMNSV